jgi:hypothetical protein
MIRGVIEFVVAQGDDAKVDDVVSEMLLVALRGVLK